MGKKGFVLGGGAFITEGQTRYVLAIVNLDAWMPSAERIPLDFLAHGIAFDPNDGHRAVMFEKKGPGACVVDLRSRKVVRSISTASSRQFYGHGAFSRDGALLYATESRLDREFEGVLVVRDAKTFDELGTLPTHGTAPHDCQIINDGKTMVIANGGGPPHGSAPSVTYVDLQTNKLLERITLRSPKFNTGHVAVSSLGDLAIVSAPRDGLPTPNQQLGAVTLRPVGSMATTVTKPNKVIQRMLGETLSVEINEEQRIVLATHPLGDCVSVWKLDDVAFIETLELRGPRGVATTLDGEWYVVSHLTENNVRLTALSVSTRKPIGVHVEPSFTTGSHLFVHDLAS